MQRFIILVCAPLLALPLFADDWPEWRGQGRRGVWNETGTLEKSPQQGLKVEWRIPIRGGYSGPSVAGRRVFISDFSPADGRRGLERALCLDGAVTKHGNPRLRAALVGHQHNERDGADAGSRFGEESRVG